jgi:hypothetical protein
LWCIVGPYLLNVKRISDSESAKTMEKWLELCNNLKKLDFNPKSKIYSIIKSNRGFKPISYTKLKDENAKLFLILQKKEFRKSFKIVYSVTSLCEINIEYKIQILLSYYKLDIK